MDINHTNIENEKKYKELIANKVRAASYKANGSEAQKLKSVVFKKYEELLRKKEQEHLSSPPKEQKIIPLNKEAILTKEFITFEFRAKVFEYFKIWIVNIFLTLLTLGIYSAWAKVRANRYLYASTFLNGANFEYSADAKKILYGRVIIVTFYILFILFSDVLYLKQAAAILTLIFFILLPWLIAQAIKFKFKSTSYRNIRFSYRGKIKSFYYLAFLFIVPILAFIAIALFASTLIKIYPFLRPYQEYLPTLLMIFTLFSFFIYYPLLYREYKKLIINNAYFGSTKFNFHGKKVDIIAIFFKITIFMILFLTFLALFTLIVGEFFSITPSQITFHSGLKLMLVYGFSITLYFVVIGFLKGLSDGYLSNFTRDNTTLANGEFKGTINPLKLAIISSSNALFLLLSLGLLYPYTKLRYLKYKIENTHFACEDYDRFLASKSKEVSTLGEESVDFFDIEIGL